MRVEIGNGQVFIVMFGWGIMISNGEVMETKLQSKVVSRDFGFGVLPTHPTKNSYEWKPIL
jgi:hypothetical protein